MTAPMSRDEIMSEFNEEDELWVARDEGSGLFLIMPDPAHPTAKPLRFFLSKQDAERFAAVMVKETESLRGKKFVSVPVKLKATIRSIAADDTPGNIDCVVVHTPNEMFAFLRGRDEV